MVSTRSAQGLQNRPADLGSSGSAGSSRAVRVLRRSRRKNGGQVDNENGCLELAKVANNGDKLRNGLHEAQQAAPASTHHISPKNIERALSDLPSRVGTLSKATCTSSSTQTLPIKPSPATSRFKRIVEQKIRKRYPGHTLDAAAKRLEFVKDMVETHQLAADNADEMCELWSSDFGADGASRRAAIRIPRQEMLSGFEHQMLLQVQDLQLELWREWYLLESETWPQFPQFRKLPPEIRHQIWRLSLRPRIIEVRPAGEELLDQLRLSYPNQPTHPRALCRQNPFGFRRYSGLNMNLDESYGPFVSGWPLTRVAHPPQFHACQESRAVTIKLYERCSEPNYHAIGNTMINYDIDTVYCPQIMSLGRCDCGQSSQEGCIYPDANALWRLAMIGGYSAKKIRSLAITHSGFDRLCDFETPRIPFGRATLTNCNLAEAMPKYANLRELIFVWAEPHEQAPALLRYWDEEVHDVHGDAFPALSEEFLQAEQEMHRAYAEEERCSPEFDQALNNLEALSIRENLGIMEREWFWDKPQLLQKLNELDVVKDGSWKVPELKMKWTRRRIKKFLR